MAQIYLSDLIWFIQIGNLWTGYYWRICSICCPALSLGSHKLWQHVPHTAHILCLDHSHNISLVPCGQASLIGPSTHHNPPSLLLFLHTCSPVLCFQIGVKLWLLFPLIFFPFLYAPTFAPCTSPHTLFPFSQSSSLGRRGKMGLNRACGSLPAATLKHTHTHKLTRP